MRKDKIYELRIDEDDEISGIDSISLVSEPAIEINWVAFNKTKKEDFIIPDGEDGKYLQFFNEKGQSEEELLNDGWSIVTEDFVSSSPNDPSFEDTTEFLVRYKYVKNPEAPGANVKETTREFCRDLISKNYVYRVEDMEAIINDQGDSALVWRGGYNCRHKWMQIKYRRDTTIVNKGSVTKGRVDGDESYDVLGYPQPDTRVPEWPSFSKSKFAKISIDYDDTLSTDRGKELAKKLLAEGNELVIVTRRQDKDMETVRNTAKDLGIDKVYNTNGELKWKKLKELGVSKHIDNNPDEIKAIKENAPEVEGVKFGYENDLPEYVDEDVTGKTEDFRAYFDYPQAATDNAKRALDWANKNGWGDCGTPVGKLRANQLAKKQGISEETISRMASFARHRQNKDVPYTEGCGGLMWDAWGGTEGIDWASRKLEQIRKETMSKQKFATDEEKRIVVGPAMIADLKIYRRDKNGDPYYVTFTAETIKMISEKYMRNKYIDNNDTEHNGKAAEDVYVIESWIKEDTNDKSNKYGYESTPIGSWFISMKVKNDEVWQRIKNKELNGFSVSGFFEEIEQFYKEQEFLRQVAELLKNIKE